MKKAVTALGIAAALLALAAAGAAAKAPSPSNPAGKLLGVVPAHGQANKLGSGGAGGNLSYHGGPVMHTNTVYAIYWLPANYTVSGTYQSLIDGFFQNVALANGANSNVYYSDTQYYDSSGAKILYNSAFPSNGAYVDKALFPANGCSDSYTSVCLSDNQIQTEITNDIVAAGWSGANPSTTRFFMFTPKGGGSCAGTSCAFSQYCAYHSWIGSGASATLYANMPYTDTVPAACDSNQYPNGDPAADSEINVISHEHNESITDPQGSAWYDKRGYEDGDKCAWNFGTTSGSTASGKYNQVINGGHYYLQQEWSNYSSRCVLQGL